MNMQIKLFTIPVFRSDSIEEEMNRFLTLLTISLFIFWHGAIGCDLYVAYRNRRKPEKP